MADPFSSVVAISTLVAALSSSVATIVQIVSTRRERLRKLRQAEHNRLDNVLEANELEGLGKFLDETIGEFNVAEYTANFGVADTIDRYLDGVVSFLGTEEEIPEERDTAADSSDYQVFVVPHHGTVDDALSKVIAELEDGEIWNALARLRREIEMFLRGIAQRQGFKDRHLRGAGQMIRLLAERELLPRDAVESLSQSVYICNRAVHGRDVTINEAREAYLLAERVLDGFAA